MDVGFKNCSDKECAEISTGMPPACKMPLRMKSARSLKCIWQGCNSPHVLIIAMTGLPSQSSLESPICIARDLCPKDRRSSGANQRADRRSEYFFFCVITDLSSIRGLGSEYPKIERQQAEVRAAFGMPKLTVGEFRELPRFLFTA